MADKTMIYVGTEAGGLYRMENLDGQWKELADGLPPTPQVRAIAIHPQKPDLVYAGTQRGVYRSVDRGDHWERARLPEGRIVWSLKFHPKDPRLMFLGTEGSEIYRSEDAGETWKYRGTVENQGAVEMKYSTRIMGLAMELSQHDHMYAAMEVGGTARSFDGGNTWKVLNRQFLGNVDLMDHHGVAVGSPQSDAIFISNRTGVWRSRDRGDNWENLQFEKFSPILYSRGVEVSPGDPNTLYACVGKTFGSEEGGVMRTTDLGETWHRFDHGVTPQSTAFGIAINAQHPEQVYFCTRRGNVIGTQDDGDMWKEYPLPESAADIISVACSSA